MKAKGAEKEYAEFTKRLRERVGYDKDFGGALECYFSTATDEIIKLFQRLSDRLTGEQLQQNRFVRYIPNITYGGNISQPLSDYMNALKEGPNLDHFPRELDLLLHAVRQYRITSAELPTLDVRTEGVALMNDNSYYVRISDLLSTHETMLDTNRIGYFNTLNTMLRAVRSASEYGNRHDESKKNIVADVCRR